VRVTSHSHKQVLVANILSMLLYTGAAMADAIVRGEAMFADTIAEYYVKDDHVRLKSRLDPMMWAGSATCCPIL